MNITAGRGGYLTLLGLTLFAGLLSRVVFDGVPILGAELGDALYAVAVYLVIRVVQPERSVGWSAAVALGLVVAIELFQLTGIPGDLAERPGDGKLFALVLGRGFRWLDLVAISVGVACAAACDAMGRR